MRWAIPELEKILKFCDQNQSLAVFDLDSTLLDVTPRSIQIIKDFKNTASYKSLTDDDKNNYAQINYQHSDWGPSAPLKRASMSKEAHDMVFKFWWSKFFINDYLSYDIPYPGALDYVQKIFSTGSDITYLTARKKQNMLDGTLQSLLDLNFPINNKQTRCVLKEKDHNDHTYKLDWLKKEIPKYTKIFYFENEAKIINHVRRELPEVEIIFMDSIHSQEDSSPVGLPTLPCKFK